MKKTVKCIFWVIHNHRKQESSTTKDYYIWSLLDGSMNRQGCMEERSRETDSSLLKDFVLLNLGKEAIAFNGVPIGALTRLQ